MAVLPNQPTRTMILVRHSVDSDAAQLAVPACNDVNEIKLNQVLMTQAGNVAHKCTMDRMTDRQKNRDRSHSIK